MKALLRKLIVGALAGCVLAGSVYAGGTGPTVFEPFIWTNDGSAAAPSHAFVSETNSGFYRAGAQDVRLSIAGSAQFRFTNSTALGLVLGTNLPLSWGVGGPDVFLYRDTANTLAQRNGTNAQAFRLYNTYTDASNYERGKFSWESNQLVIATEKAGTGSDRSILIQRSNGSSLQLGSSTITVVGGFLWTSDNTYDIGASGANRPRTIYVGTNGIFGQSVQVGTSSSISFASRTAMVSGADGNLALSVNAGGNFGLLQFGGATSSFPALKRSSAALQVRLADDSANAALEAKTVKTDGFTVATLPTCNAGAAGTRAYVTDATAPTYLAALVGGGAVVAPAFCNGTAWVSD